MREAVPPESSQRPGREQLSCGFERGVHELAESGEPNDNIARVLESHGVLTTCGKR